MELFVFIRMGGQHDDIAVRLLEGGDSLVRQLERFDAGKAKCFLNRDRQRLWAVIEASFGTFEPFNDVVRAMFALKIEEAKAARARVKKLRRPWQAIRVIMSMASSLRENSRRQPPHVPPIPAEVAEPDEAI